MQKDENKKNLTGMEVAVIGMVGRFPGAKNYHQYWENLKNGVESISFLAHEQLAAAGVDPQLINDPGYVKSGGGILEDKEYFDSSFFDYSPREAEIMDPQVRIFHECAWEALEDAGYDPLSYNGLIGLYGGSSANFYWEGLTLLSGKVNELGAFAAEQLVNKDYLTARVSYKLNLKGANSTIHTACSTSLVAIHQACRALLTGECGIALAGGVSIKSTPPIGYMHQEGMISSPDGHTRAFAAEANGTNGGSGVGIVVLKLLKNALTDRDYIHALIKGSAVNNDGNRKVGFTAPSVEAQAEVVRKAIRMTRVEPESITYIETHGTATPLGDPVEIEALKRAFKGKISNKKNFCALGSVKTNIGHLDTAAGVAGFIKTVLALKHKQIPPSLHFETPNPKIDFENSPFYVNTRLQEWKNSQNPLRAGVSSFGIGGTNAHVILEEALLETRDLEGTGGVAPLFETGISRDYQLILLSGKTASALDKITENLVEYFKKNCVNPGNPVNPGADPRLTLADAAYTLQVGRRAFKYRQRFVCSTIDEAIETLSKPGSRHLRTMTAASENPPVIFMFTGVGAQYVNMGRELYQKEPVFREEMDRCFEILNSLLDYDIKEILYPHPDCRGGSPCPPQDCVESPGQGHSAQLPGTWNSPLERGNPDPRKGGDVFNINQSRYTHTVIFTFEYALAKLLMHWGIQPHALIGYSLGEYTAACISGVFSLQEALRLVQERARLIQRIPGGAMLGVPLSEKQLTPFLIDIPQLSIAIDNGDSCIAAGPRTALDILEKKLKEKKYMCLPVDNAYALHSAEMEPILQEFKDILEKVPVNPPEIPYISNVTGDWITVEQATDPGYWARHLRQTVRFAEGIKKLIKEPNAVFVEIGPGNDLSTLIRRFIDGDSGQQVLNLVRHPKKEISDVHYLMKQIGNLWLYGKKVQWSALHNGQKRQRLPLPVYPFERQRYWIDHDPLRTGMNTIGAVPLQYQGVITAQPGGFGGDILNLEKQLEKQLEIKGIHCYQGFEAITNRLCCSLICDYFKSHHIGIEAGQIYEDKNQLKKMLKLLPKFTKFLDFFIKVLQEDNIIAVKKNKIRFLKSVAEIEDPVILKEKAREKFPRFSGTFESVTYCAAHYVPALNGEIEAISVLFPGGRYFRDAPLYKNQEEYDNSFLYIELLHRYIIEHVLPGCKVANKRNLRILEVGGGNGILTRRLAADLKRTKVNLNLEYYFTDIGKFFVINAEKEAVKQGLDFMKFGVLDISKDPVTQGYETYSFDIILALNVVHATRSIEESIRHLKKLLRPNGFMALVEGTNPPRWMHMIDGLAEGWWYFEDEHIRQDSPLLSPGQWETVVQQQGFASVTVFPQEEGKRQETSCCLILARQVTTVEKKEEETEPPTTLYRRPQLTAPYAAPGDETERVLAGIFQNFFGIEQVGIEDDFFELGMDSLIATALTARVQEKLNIRLPAVELYNAATIRRLAHTIKSMEKEIHHSTARSDILVLLKKGTDPRTQLFLVHGGSGEVGLYLELCSHLNSRFNCWGIRANPGKIQHYAPRNISVEESAKKYLEKIQKIQPNGPYYIAGWSSGAPIAFEMVRLLEQMNKKIGFLGIISSTPPQKEWWYKAKAFTIESELQWIRDFFQDTNETTILKDITNIDQLWVWMVNYLETNHFNIEMLSKMVPPFMVNAIPDYQQLGIREWIYYLNVVRIYMNAQAFYIPAGKINTQIHLFKATETEIPNREIWNTYTVMPYRELPVIGTHHSIFKMPEVINFAKQFNRGIIKSFQ